MASKKPANALVREQRKILVAALCSTIVCGVALVAGYLWLPLYVWLPQSMLERIVFVLRLDVFILLWLVFAVGVVSRARRHSAADINAALSGPPSRELAIKIAFLQNTLEQAVLAVGAHLALATLIAPELFSLLIVSTALFALGRITFLYGYKRGAGGRAFGMVTTTLPTILGYIYAIILITRL